MNNNPINSGQRRFPPTYNPDQQYPQDRQSLYPMGHFLETPAPAVKPETIPQYDPAASKKILGMPQDRFTALLGTLAHAIAPQSFGGRLGAGMVNISNLLRNERMLQGRQESAVAGAKYKATAETLKAQAEKRGKVPTVKHFQVGNRSVPHSFNPDTREWELISGMRGKEVEGKSSARDKGFKQIEGVWHTGTWGKGDDFTPRRQATKAEIAKLTTVEPPAEEKPATRTEKRAQRKELRGLEASILGVDPKTGKANVDYPEAQISVDDFNELTKGPYVYQRTEGTPKQVVDWGRDVPAVPAKLEKVDVSTPEKIMDSNLPDDMKRRLLLKRFPSKFE